MEHGLRLTLAYDGTDFAGYQAQLGQRTVQGVLTEAVMRVCRHDVVVRAASRTDAGVHAEGQIAAFATSRELSPERWLLALNRYLPPDVAVCAAQACEPQYQPRFDATDKLYRYQFHVGPVRDPSSRRFAWHVGRFGARRGQRGTQLDLAAMHAACAVLRGTHDFRAFRAAADTRSNTERTLFRVELCERYRGVSELLALEVHGNAFMMNMVRILAGTLIDVGRRRLTPRDIERLLDEDGQRAAAGMTAPAHGLTLVQVNLGRLREVASR